MFKEVPLLFEGGYESFYNEVIIVLRDKQKRIQSIIKRDGLTKQEIENRIKNQFNYENNQIFKHTVIYNDGSLIQLERSVKAVVNEIIKKA